MAAIGLPFQPSPLTPSLWLLFELPMGKWEPPLAYSRGGSLLIIVVGEMTRWPQPQTDGRATKRKKFALQADQSPKRSRKMYGRSLQLRLQLQQPAEFAPKAKVSSRAPLAGQLDVGGALRHVASWPGRGATNQHIGFCLHLNIAWPN